MLVRSGLTLVTVLVLATATSAGVADQPRTPPDFSDVSSAGPAWSPDGARIAYVSIRGKRRGIFVMRADGSKVRLVLGGSVSLPAWSPDGRELAYGAYLGEIGYLGVVGVDGSRPRRLIRTGRYTLPSPDWSPDGRRIVFETRGGISVVGRDGSGLQTVVRGSNLTGPAWSPDGTTIAFASADDAERAIETVKVDGTQRRRLLGRRAWVSEPSWSPDGARLAFVDHESDHSSHVAVMNADGSGVERITTRRWSVSAPSWAPDGSRIAFSAAEPPTYEPTHPAYPRSEIYTIGTVRHEVVRLTFGGCTIVGTVAPDVLLGTGADDVICGFDGNDLIRAGVGDDKVVGGPGDDTIWGGPGVDRLSGEEGADTLDGGPGSDTLRGGLGDDRIRSRSLEADTVDGEPGTDTADSDRQDVLVDVERGEGGTRKYRPTLSEIRKTVRAAAAASGATLAHLGVDLPAFSFVVHLRVPDPGAYLRNRLNTVVHALAPLEDRAWKLGTGSYRVYGPSGLVFSYKGSHRQDRNGSWTASYCVAEEFADALYSIDLFFGEIEGEGGPARC